MCPKLSSYSTHSFLKFCFVKKNFKSSSSYSERPPRRALHYRPRSLERQSALKQQPTNQPRRLKLLSNNNSAHHSVFNNSIFTERA